MVQISTSTVVVAVLAASALAAPAYDVEDMSLSRREPEPKVPTFSGARAAIGNQMHKLKGAVKGLRKDKSKEKNRLAKDIASGNFKDARKAEKAIQGDNRQIGADLGKENTLRTAAQDLNSREFDDFEYELVRRNPPVATKPKKSAAARARKAATNANLSAAFKKEDGVLRGKARTDRQNLRKEKSNLAADISKGDFAAAVKDEAAIKSTKSDLSTVRQNEATLQQIEKANARREFFDDEFELEAREFDDFEYELVRRNPPVSSTKPRKSAAARTRKAATNAKLNAAFKKEDGVLRGKARTDRQNLRKEKSNLAADISKGNFAAAAKDEAAIQSTKSDLSTVRQNEATLQQIEKANARREFFDDEFELEARDFDEYELEARDFFDGELEERGFYDYELEMLD
jgi:hypothetical protein